MLLSAPLSNQGSPELLKELLQQSQGKQRMGQARIRGSKIMQTKTSSLKSNILPPANKMGSICLSQSPQLSRHVGQGCLHPQKHQSPALPDSCKENREQSTASQQHARICVHQVSHTGKTERKRILSSRERYREL